LDEGELPAHLQERLETALACPRLAKQVLKLSRPRRYLLLQPSGVRAESFLLDLSAVDPPHEREEDKVEG